MTTALTSAATADDVAEALDRDGYAVVEGVLSREEAAAKRAELTRVLQETPTGRNDFEGFKTQRIYALFAKTRAFDGPATHPLVLGVLDRVLGQSYQLSAPVGHPDRAGRDGAGAAHATTASTRCRAAAQEIVLNTMWALDDFTEANGATRVVPGSHKWLDQRPDASTQTICAEMPAGSVLFFTGSVFHGGGANQTDKPRLGTILEYVAGWLRQQENHVLAVPREVVKTLDPRLQELLGYNIHPPFMGYVDGRHPRKVLEGEVGSEKRAARSGNGRLRDLDERAVLPETVGGACGQRLRDAVRVEEACEQRARLRRGAGRGGCSTTWHRRRRRCARGRRAGRCQRGRGGQLVVALDDSGA